MDQKNVPILLQERIMSEPFGREGEVFRFSLFLVLANRILTFSVAATFLWVTFCIRLDDFYQFILQYFQSVYVPWAIWQNT